MPASVIATGLVDVVVAPEKMPEALLEYVRRAGVTRADRRRGRAEPKPLEGLPAILAVLRARTKHDFRGYKKGHDSAAHRAPDGAAADRERRASTSTFCARTRRRWISSAKTS